MLWILNLRYFNTGLFDSYRFRPVYISADYFGVGYFMDQPFRQRNLY